MTPILSSAANCSDCGGTDKPTSEWKHYWHLCIDCLLDKLYAEYYDDYGFEYYYYGDWYDY
jgi:hypothetical protein